MRFLLLVALISVFLTPAWCQDNPAQKTGFKLFMEKTYLHTDRETYSAGEDIWFSAFLVNAQANTLFDGSQNLYVELIDPTGQMIAREMVRLEKGLGHGDFHLSDSTVSGNYRLRAYTSWMRNFGDNLLFEKQVRIYNGKTVAGITKNASVPAAASLGFFPEGGAMIDSVPGILAIKAINAAGEGIAVKGTIKSDDQDNGFGFETDAAGFGSIQFTASANTVYTAVASSSDGRVLRATLPRVLSKGLSLFIRQADSLIRVTITTNAATYADMKDTRMIFLVKHKDRAILTLAPTLSARQVSFTVAKSKLSGGLNSVILFDNSGRPQCERLIYIEPAEKVNVSITPQALSGAPKSKTTLEIRATDQTGKPVSADFSLAVVDAGIVPVNEGNIISYLELQSEVRGTIANAAAYFDEKDPMRYQKLDLLLLTQGWRDFIWKRLADSVLKISYPLEQGISITGKVKPVWAAKGMPDMQLTMTAWRAKGGKIFSAKTDSAGRFSLDGIDITGTEYADITSVNSKGKKAGYIVIDTVTVNDFPTIRQNKTIDTTARPPGKFEIETDKRKIISGRVNLSDTLQLNAVELNAKKPPGRTLGDTTFVIKKGDYPLKYLRNYMMETMPGATYHSRIPEIVGFMGMAADGSYTWRPPIFSSSPPTAKRLTRMQWEMLLVKRLDYFNLPMDKINSVRLVHNRNHDGVVEFADGLLGDYFDIFLDLKPHAFDRQGFQKINIEIAGYYESREFFAPVYETPSAKPDVRTTIHWAPAVTTNSKGEATISYYNADLKSTVRVVAEGISAGGVPFAAIASYEVK